MKLLMLALFLIASDVKASVGCFKNTIDGTPVVRVKINTKLVEEIPFVWRYTNTNEPQYSARDVALAKCQTVIDSVQCGGVAECEEFTSREAVQAAKSMQYTYGKSFWQAVMDEAAKEHGNDKF